MSLGVALEVIMNNFTYLFMFVLSMALMMSACGIPSRNYTENLNVTELGVMNDDYDSASRNRNKNFQNIGSSCIFAASTATLDIKDNIFLNFGLNSFYINSFGRYPISLVNSTDVYLSGNSNESVYKRNVSYRNH